MSRTKWDKKVQQEFDNMDSDERASFADLRERVERGASSRWHFTSIWGD